MPQRRLDPAPPEQIRADMVQVRGTLAAHLCELKNRLFQPQLTTSGDSSEMPTKKRNSRAGPASSRSGQGTKARTRPAAESEGSESPPADRSGTKTKRTSPKTQAKSANGSKPKAGEAKGSKGSEKASTRKKPAARARKSPGLLEKTGEALDTLVAGAMVGAVTGAAQAVGDEPTAVGSTTMVDCEPLVGTRAEPAGTSEVLGELAGGAAAGAVAGAAKSMLVGGRAPASRRRKNAKKG